ncbi:MAG TPA: sulfatase-like hydrolase/transferase [Chitinophagales bacterium]|nr:sulfatase-like hydrolase/transferase [Chitinophagales bacterium]
MKLNSIKIHYLIKLLIFWLLFFAGFRLLFVIYHHTKIPDGQHAETGLAFFHALPLDLSTACAGLIVPYILWSFQQFYKRRWIHVVNISFVFFLIIAVTVLSIANIKLYGEWGTLLSARAFDYILYPKEVLHSISRWSLFLLLAGCILISYLTMRAYRVYITNFSYPIENKTLKLSIIIITPILLLLGYRGGFQQTPINESQSYYSSMPINNNIATNNIWYLAHSLWEANDVENPYILTGKEEAKEITASLFETPEQNIPVILKSTRPNIVIIILESWTADIIAALGGEKGITPHFDELRKQGLLFTQMYSSGSRTDQGLVSILSGFPSQPNNSIITTPSKTDKLPSLTTELIKQGYSSSFYYGGEIEFANMKSYLVKTGIEKIVEKGDFPASQLNSKWGAHDEFVLQKQLNAIGSQRRPFFSVVLTLSTHEPFEVTMQTPFKRPTEEDKFKKAAYYTDYCLFNYFNQAKKQSWYQNTVFLLVADHGHHLPENRNMNYPESRRITALLFGGALVDSVRGKTVDKICNQNDLPSILLSQLNLPTRNFKWSRNVLNNQTKEFAYYSNENFLGWITPEKNYVYSFVSKTVEELPGIHDSSSSPQAVKEAKAYLQTLYQTYLDY